MGEIYNNYVDRLQAEIDLKVEEGGMIISDPDIWILSTWFADEGLSLGDKEEFLAAIEEMQQQDPEMYAALKRGNIARSGGIRYEKAWSLRKRKEKRDLEDPFYSKENMEKLEKRVNDIRSGTSTLKEHPLIEDFDGEYVPEDVDWGEPVEKEQI